MPRGEKTKNPNKIEEENNKVKDNKVVALKFDSNKHDVVDMVEKVSVDLLCDLKYFLLKKVIFGTI